MKKFRWLSSVVLLSSSDDDDDDDDKWSKYFDIRPHRRSTWTVQLYSSGGANVHPIYRKAKNGCHSNIP